MIIGNKIKEVDFFYEIIKRALFYKTLPNFLIILLNQANRGSNSQTTYPSAPLLQQCHPSMSY
jgi:hypothetical protein